MMLARLTLKRYISAMFELEEEEVEEEEEEGGGRGGGGREGGLMLQN